MKRTRRSPRRRNPDSKTGLFLLLAVGAAAVFYFYKRGSSASSNDAPVFLPPPPTPEVPPVTQAPPPPPALPKPVKVKSVPLAAKQKALNDLRKTIYDYSASVMGDPVPLALFEPLVEDGDPGSKSRAALALALYTMEYGKGVRKDEIDRFRKPECRWFAQPNAAVFTGALERERASRAGKPDWNAKDITLIESLTKSVAPTSDDLWFVYAGARSATGDPAPKIKPSMRDFTG